MANKTETKHDSERLGLEWGIDVAHGRCLAADELPGVISDLKRFLRFLSTVVPRQQVAQLTEELSTGDIFRNNSLTRYSHSSLKPLDHLLDYSHTLDECPKICKAYEILRFAKEAESLESWEQRFSAINPKSLSMIFASHDAIVEHIYEHAASLNLQVMYKDTLLDIHSYRQLGEALDYFCKPESVALILLGVEYYAYATLGPEYCLLLTALFGTKETYRYTLDQCVKNLIVENLSDAEQSIPYHTVEVPYPLPLLTEEDVALPNQTKNLIPE